MTPAQIVRRLHLLGFAATANDVRCGSTWTSEIVERLRRDAPNRQADNRSAILAFADELEETLRDPRRRSHG